MFVFSKIARDFKLPMFPLEMLFESGNKSREKIQSFDILPRRHSYRHSLPLDQPIGKRQAQGVGKQFWRHFLGIVSLKYVSIFDEQDLLSKQFCWHTSIQQSLVFIIKSSLIQITILLSSQCLLKKDVKVIFAWKCGDLCIKPDSQKPIHQIHQNEVKYFAWKRNSFFLVIQGKMGRQLILTFANYLKKEKSEILWQGGLLNSLFERHLVTFYLRAWDR